MKTVLLLTFGALTLQYCKPAEDFSKSVFLKYYGKEGNHSAADLLVNSDGSFYILGTMDSKTRTVTNSGIYLAKADKDGNFIWENTYTLYMENSKNPVEQCVARDMEFTSDGNLLILANVGEPAQSFQVIKVNPTTNNSEPLLTMYSKSADKTAVKATSISRISGGGNLPAGYVICGLRHNEPTTSASDALQIFVDENLAEAPNFTTIYNQGTRDAAVKAFQFKDSHILIFGYTNSPTDSLQTSNFWVYLLDQYGVPTANRKIVFKANTPDAKDDTDEYAATAIQTGLAQGKGYMICGFTQSTDPQLLSAYPVFLKLTSELLFQASDIEFYKSINGSECSLQIGNIFESRKDEALKIASVCAARDGGYYALYTRNTTKGEIVLHKLDIHGNELWNRVFGGDFEDYAAALYEGIDGSIIVCGTITVGTPVTSNKKIALIKLNAEGKLE